MATAVTITQQQKTSLISAIRGNAASQEQRFQAKWLLNGVRASDNYKEALRRFLESEEATIPELDAEKIAALIETYVQPRNEGGSWLGGLFGYSSGNTSGGVGSAFGLQAAQTLVEGLRPQLDRLFTNLEDIKPHLKEVLGRLKGDLKPHIDEGLAWFMQRVGGKAKTPPERWADIIGKARTLLDALHEGAASGNQERLGGYKADIMRFVRELRAEAKEAKACFSLKLPEEESLSKMFKMLKSLDLTKDLTSFRKEDSHPAATAPSTPASTPRPPSARAHLQAHSNPAPSTSHPSEPLSQGIETLRAIDSRYVSIVARIKHGIDIKPGNEVLGLKDGIKVLQRRLPYLSECDTLEGEDAQTVIKLYEAIESVLQKPTVDAEHKNSLYALQKGLFEERAEFHDPGTQADPATRQEPKHWTIDSEQNKVIFLEIDPIVIAQLNLKIDEALESLEKIIQEEAGFWYIVSQQIGSGAEKTEAYLHEHFLDVRSDAKLLSVYKVLNLFHSFNVAHYDRVITRDEFRDIRDAVNSARNLLEENNLASFLPASSKSEDRERFREILSVVSALTLPDETDRVSYPLNSILEFDRSLFASSSETRIKDIRLITSALRVKGETVAGAVSRIYAALYERAKREGTYVSGQVERRVRDTISECVDDLAGKFGSQLQNVINEALFKVFIYSCAFVAFVVFASISGYALHRRINQIPVTALS
jgi:hypothetical protein